MYYCLIVLSNVRQLRKEQMDIVLYSRYCVFFKFNLFVLADEVFKVKITIRLLYNLACGMS
jgi:hypothetical protein